MSVEDRNDPKSEYQGADPFDETSIVNLYAAECQWQRNRTRSVETQLAMAYAEIRRLHAVNDNLTHRLLRVNFHLRAVLDEGTRSKNKEKRKQKVSKKRKVEEVPVTVEEVQATVEEVPVSVKDNTTEWTFEPFSFDSNDLPDLVNDHM